MGKSVVKQFRYAEQSLPSWYKKLGKPVWECDNGNNMPREEYPDIDIDEKVLRCVSTGESPCDAQCCLYRKEKARETIYVRGMRRGKIYYIWVQRISKGF